MLRFIDLDRSSNNMARNVFAPPNAVRDFLYSLPVFESAVCVVSLVYFLVK